MFHLLVPGLVVMYLLMQNKKKLKKKTKPCDLAAHPSWITQILDEPLYASTTIGFAVRTSNNIHINVYANLFQHFEWQCMGLPYTIHPGFAECSMDEQANPSIWKKNDQTKIEQKKRINEEKKI